MRRTVALLLLVLGAAGCGTADSGGEPLRPARPAEPQRTELDWRETHPAPKGERLVFEVGTLAVTADGWSATVAVTNRTPYRFQISTGPSGFGFGVMLFATGNLKEVEDANREGQLPAVRRATTIVPEPPAVLLPSATWRATLSAPGSLADKSFVRVVFGTFLGEDDAPEEFRRVVWFTDHAHRL